VTSVIACRLPSPEAEQLRRLAVKRGATISDELRRLVREHLTTSPAPA
jgi:hypothetical protein